MINISARQARTDTTPRAVCPRVGTGSLGEKVLETEVAPNRFFNSLHGSLDTESCMLIWNYIVFVVRVERSMLWLDHDFFDGKLDADEILEQICVK